MATLEELVGDYMNIAPDVDLDKNEQDIAYLKMAVELMAAGSIPVGEAAVKTPNHFVPEQAAAIQGSPWVYLDLDTALDTQVAPGTPANEDVVIGDPETDRAVVVTEGWYDVFGALYVAPPHVDETAENIVFGHYVSINEEDYGPGDNFIAKTYVPPNSPDAASTCFAFTAYLNVDDYLQWQCRASGDPVEDINVSGGLLIVTRR